ncbi:nucleotidyltransferase domain-containing protein [Actinophytocola sediminis]
MTSWEPASLGEVVALFSGLSVPWWVAGGHAIELAVGHPIREHGDIDVLLLRRDQLAAQQALAGWEWWAADPPGVLRPWRPEETLTPQVHDVWCRPNSRQPWRIQLMLDESHGTDWVSHRDARVRRPITALGRTSADGTPYLTPEIQLFYKAKEPRPKDEMDFTTALPHLTVTQRAWLHRAITDTYGQHPWLPALR